MCPGINTLNGGGSFAGLRSRTSALGAAPATLTGTNRFKSVYPSSTTPSLGRVPATAPRYCGRPGDDSAKLRSVTFPLTAGSSRRRLTRRACVGRARARGPQRSSAV